MHYIYNFCLLTHHFFKRRCVVSVYAKQLCLYANEIVVIFITMFRLTTKLQTNVVLFSYNLRVEYWRNTIEFRKNMI